ncbi:uncharacterized protein PV09_05802 [Verruconis gallopava]|uniref:Uncharacterized protein n=1 Tax=Verruconis gallopava TaxID=253628 RepID=A0A0D2AVJ1_9PEZI|nr:uncharacterized protein PV09_05802 [Verruconis gallopava]KIW03159.1 hypothetical protein PV09_05802 [Verruconis gallopava]
MDLRCQYVPLTWYNNGYIGSVHSALDLRSPLRTPPPPYVEKAQPLDDDMDVHPAFRHQHGQKPIIYATVYPMSPQLKTNALLLSSPSSPSTPSSPRSSRSSMSSEDGRAPSLCSDTSTLSDWSSSSMHSMSNCNGPSRTLRRSRRRARGMSLRELRAKQSEADLQRVYAANVEEYLSGDIFDNFRIWPEPVIAEET